MARRGPIPLIDGMPHTKTILSTPQLQEVSLLGLSFYEGSRSLGCGIWRGAGIRGQGIKVATVGLYEEDDAGTSVLFLLAIATL